MKNLLCIFLLCPALLSSRDVVSEHTESLFRAELAFASMSVEKGRKTAFITFLAEDSILFRPGPVAGKKWFTEAPEAQGLLSWRPTVAVVSANGNFGYTTGPWEFYEKTMREPPVSHGQFLSVWRKEADGVWRVVIDSGNMNPSPLKKDESIRKEQLSNGQTCDPKKAKEALLVSDREFSELSASSGALKAFPAFVTQQARALREDLLPVIGAEKIQEYLALSRERLKWQPQAAEVSDSCDIGYTYGAAQIEVGLKSQSGHYLRIWRNDSSGSWKVAIDLVVPDPPQL